MIDINLYDGVEVDPVALVGRDQQGREILERCEPGDPNIYCWSVYLHLKEGGVECISDHANEAAAGFIAHALRVAYPTLRPTIEPGWSRWACPACGSHDVQVSLPAWHRESCSLELQYLETDAEASVMWWYCNDCDESGTGEPTEIKP